MPVSPDEFRHALGRWASGVTIVTSRAGDRVHGMTVSSFSSVSLDPPLVLVCADKSSNTDAMIAEARVFAVNILSADQKQLSQRFASKKDEHLRFQGVETRTGVTGAPLVCESLMSLDCSLVHSHEAGDHVIHLGRVEAIASGRGAEPLLYYRGAYRSLR